MSIEAKFVHTNLIARDWRRLARFYEEVLGCKPVPPERDLAGDWLDAATGLTGAQIQGIHLRLPGHGDGGPTIEIFQYSRPIEPLATAVNRPGFGHIAFAVGDVQMAYDAVLAAGGRTVGEIQSLEIPKVGQLTFAYMADPEGNVIELQHWGS